jgi:hypothetical protein
VCEEKNYFQKGVKNKNKGKLTFENYAISDIITYVCVVINLNIGMGNFDFRFISIQLHKVATRVFI